MVGEVEHLISTSWKTQDTLRIYIQVKLFLLIEALMLLTQLPCLVIPLEIPAGTRCCKQLAPVDVENTRKIANVRIHVERIIGSVRQCFQILSATGVLQNEFCLPQNPKWQCDTGFYSQSLLCSLLMV